MNRENEPVRDRLLPGAVALYALWTLATYLLEGRLHTLLRPEAAGARLAYAVVANGLVGIVGAGLLLAAAVRRGRLTPPRLGLRAPGRTAWSMALGLGLGLGLFALQQPASRDPVVVANAFAQVWVVSVAEVLVCWVVLGRAVEAAVVGAARPRWAGALAGWLAAAVAFGAYHFAHSPPFDTAAMVGLLTGVGLVTGAFYFGVDELYGTLLFHNALALKGVTEALAASGRLADYATLRPALLLTALAATALLVAVDRWVRRAAPEAAGPARASP